MSGSRDNRRPGGDNGYADERFLEKEERERLSFWNESIASASQAICHRWGSDGGMDRWAHDNEKRLTLTGGSPPVGVTPQTVSGDQRNEEFGDARRRGGDDDGVSAKKSFRHMKEVEDWSRPLPSNEKVERSVSVGVCLCYN